MKARLYKNLLGVVIVLLIMWLLMYIGNKKNDKIISNGAYTILTVTKVNHPTYYGYNITYCYNYNGLVFYDSSVSNQVDQSSIGKHFFLILDKDNPHNYLILRSVPSWFTLDAPPEGWKTMPNEVEMRDMMVQDSIKRGLK